MAFGTSLPENHYPCIRASCRIGTIQSKEQNEKLFTGVKWNKEIVPHLILTKYLLFRTELNPVLDGKDVKYIVLAIKELSIDKLIIIVTD